MDILGLLQELSSAGISEVVLLIVIPVAVRYLIIKAASDLRKEMRQEVRDALDDKSKEIYRYMDARFDAQDARFDAHDKRFDQLDARLDAHDKRFDRIDARLDAHDRRFDQSDRKNEARAYDVTMHLIDIRERLANIEGRMGIYPPRRGLEPPVPEPVVEAESSEPSQG